MASSDPDRRTDLRCSADPSRFPWWAEESLEAESHVEHSLPLVAETLELEPELENEEFDSRQEKVAVQRGAPHAAAKRREEMLA